MKSFLPLLFLFLFLGCSDDEDTRDVFQIQADNDTAILAFLEENNITAQSSVSGLYYVINEPGSGQSPTVSDDVTVFFSGYNLDGVVFDETDGITPFSSPLGGLIRGWQEGLPKISEGGSMRLFLPSHLAFFSREPSFNAPVIFDIELVSVN